VQGLERLEATGQMNGEEFFFIKKIGQLSQKSYAKDEVTI
jgi:hypothetical protein